MDQPVRILLDAPTSPVSKVQVAMIGDNFNDPRYGDFKITREEVEAWKRNLSALPGGRALIDADHKADAPKPFRDTEAYGWITGVELEAGKPMATVEWTPKGQEAIEQKRYLFLSPVFGPHRTHTGDVIKDVLSGASLTNKPFLPMPQVQLCAEDTLRAALLDEEPAQLVHRLLLEGVSDTDVLKELANVSAAVRKEYAAKGWALPDGSYPIGNKDQLHSAAVLASSGHGDVEKAKALIRRRAKDLGVDVSTLPGFGSGSSSDTRRQMEFTADTLKKLGITDEAVQKRILDAAKAEDADMVKVLEMIDEAKPKTEPAKPAPAPEADDAARKQLEAQAREQGLILLDGEAGLKLLADAAAGAQAAKDLATERFDNAWQKALDAGRAVPAQEELYRQFYDAKPTETLKMLESAPQAVNTKPRGRAVNGDDLDAPEGIDEAGYQLDREVQKYITDHKLDPQADYLKALEAVSGTRLVTA